MKNKINEKEIKKLVGQHNDVLDKLLEDVFEDNSVLVVVLKYHYTMEFLIDKLLEIALDKPNLILKKSFSEKIKLFQAMGLDNGDEKLMKMIFGLNQIRNKFAHNPKFNLWSHEGSKLIKNIGASGKNNTARFTNGFLYVSGYLRTMWSYRSIFPIMSSIMEPESDPWLANTLAQKEMEKEIKRFNSNRRLSKLLTDPYN